MTSPEFLELEITVYSGAETAHYPISLEFESTGVDEFVQMLRLGKPPRDYVFYTTAVKLTDEIIQSAGLCEN